MRLTNSETVVVDPVGNWTSLTLPLCVGSGIRCEETSGRGTSRVLEHVVITTRPDKGNLSLAELTPLRSEGNIHVPAWFSANSLGRR